MPTQEDLDAAFKESQRRERRRVVDEMVGKLIIGVPCYLVVALVLDLPPF